MTEAGEAHAGAHDAMIVIEENDEDRESLDAEDSPDGLERK